ncbi:glycosyltransferase family A protein [Gloeocapsopsis sp. IPPAS B-1203]|uniref:glycosyltransferase family A protein n=1 Tax=Gloeocapsopsis sp. IPPAS B-1203 TaxID=2049454 RepID=UPI000C19297D|nr:glycosyltransferase family A protein [Gloeocapsopsis sp. IPPAS B-1203]PIG94076.1 glycosyl transferase family 2 [Gloeocapsopsis sp. IPPAS B-1203]
MENSVAELPSFSIVFETENLSSVELENIYLSLASLEKQNMPITSANEFLIIDGGYAPQEVIEQISSKYTWINIKQIPGIGYHEAKMMGATLATGEIVVFCDSDCVYNSNWLKSILTTFSQNSDINIVAGETSTLVRNPYELAIAIHYFFPRFSYQEQPYVSQGYYLNSVAFRRDFLLQNPIPIKLPLYRSNCQIHIHYLRSHGYNILKHPQAQANHEPPTMSFISWRYLLRGRDRVLREQIKLSLANSTDLNNISQLTSGYQLTRSQKIYAVIRTLWQAKPFKKAQIRAVLQEDSLRIFCLPLAIPIVIYFELLYTISSIITYFQPNLLLNLYTQKGARAGELTTA